MLSVPIFPAKYPMEDPMEDKTAYLEYPTEQPNAMECPNFQRLMTALVTGVDCWRLLPVLADYIGCLCWLPEFDAIV